MKKREFAESLVGKASFWQKLKACFFPVKLGEFRGPGLISPMEFYLFLCQNCDRFSADYLHGYRDVGANLYCHLCNDI